MKFFFYCYTFLEIRLKFHITRFTIWEIFHLNIKKILFLRHVIKIYAIENLSFKHLT